MFITKDISIYFLNCWLPLVIQTDHLQACIKSNFHALPTKVAYSHLLQLVTPKRICVTFTSFSKNCHFFTDNEVHKSASRFIYYFIILV